MKRGLIVSPSIVLTLFNGYGIGGVIGALSGAYLVVAVLMAVAGIETNRRSLEALEPGAVLEPVPDAMLSPIRNK